MHLNRNNIGILGVVLSGLIFFSSCGDESVEPPAAQDEDPEPDPADPEPEPDPAEPGPVLVTGGSNIVLLTVVVGDGGRTTYVQTVDGLDDGPFTNANALEFSGNTFVMAQGRNFYVGRQNAPVWERYSVSEAGEVRAAGSLSLEASGAAAIPFGTSVILSDEQAVTVFSSEYKLTVWNPTAMTISNEIDLSSLLKDGTSLESWTTVSVDGKVYIPTRWATTTNEIVPVVGVAIFDPNSGEVKAIEDGRCASSGRIVEGEDGYIYVMGDGRVFASHLSEIIGGPAALDNCLLRIDPTTMEFDEDFYASIPDLVDGDQTITEMAAGGPASQFAAAKVFRRGLLPDDYDLSDYLFWDEPVHEMIRFQLGDEPEAVAVEGMPLTSIGFSDVSFGGKVYSTGAVTDDGFFDVYEMDLETNQAVVRFTVEAYLAGLLPLEGAQ